MSGGEGVVPEQERVSRRLAVGGGEELPNAIEKMRGRALQLK